MNQKPAQISQELFDQLIFREFGQQAKEVTDKLQKVNCDSDSGRRRIGAAILKHSKGDINELDELIKQANTDFRDVVAWAEYPRAFKVGWGELSDQEEREMNVADWNEYQNWLKIRS